ncbi:hypothetical protein [Nocardia aurantia]|uniref:hypothetical protein n=1 Tax=Nocardia aurantia TaxID=2585199 RepID=UPI001297486A|nr:hypothetical protein [Nocardia aurantia]
MRHIHIELGALRLDFQAGAEQAQSVADELAASFSELDLSVVVDDDVQPGLPFLPCSGLWD